MGFVKIVKNKAYYKRYQVKFKRRRECVTDYYARKRLIIQDKNKYKTPKYRFVVRFTNADIICQIFSADLTHDVCVASAYAHELARFGVKVASKNYAAAYCTGLLLARRINAKFNLDYEGNKEINGEDYNVEADEEGKAPFKAVLDVGLKRTTTGGRIFGALKGLCDGGVNCPHSDTRFPGSKADESGTVEANPETHRKYIFGLHISEYMRKLKEDNEEGFKRQFSAYLRNGVNPDEVESMYKKAHAAIRKDPNKKREPLELGHGYQRKRQKPRGEDYKPKKKQWQKVKLSVEQRKAHIKQKLIAKGHKSLRSAIKLAESGAILTPEAVKKAVDADHKPPPARKPKAAGSADKAAHKGGKAPAGGATKGKKGKA